MKLSSFGSEVQPGVTSTPSIHTRHLEDAV
jgi:hypothetical protein